MDRQTLVTSIRAIHSRDSKASSLWNVGMLFEAKANKWDGLVTALKAQEIMKSTKEGLGCIVI